MLAQNFKSAAELGIRDEVRTALMKTLVLMETGKLNYVKIKETDGGLVLNPKFSGYFNMGDWCTKQECGTVCCIGGTAELIGGITDIDDDAPSMLIDLFYPNLPYDHPLKSEDITVEQAARALRNYLTVGEPKWVEAVA